MLLGDIIAQLEDEDFAMEALIGLGDLALVSQVQAAAATDGLTPGEFASQAVRIFADTASDDDWVSLIGVMGRSMEPGQVCLRKMIDFALAPRATDHACGHHHANHHA